MTAGPRPAAGALLGVCSECGRGQSAEPVKMANGAPGRYPTDTVTRSRAPSAMVKTYTPSAESPGATVPVNGAADGSFRGGAGTCFSPEVRFTATASRPTGSPDRFSMRTVTRSAGPATLPGPIPVPWMAFSPSSDTAIPSSTSAASSRSTAGRLGGSSSATTGSPGATGAGASGDGGVTVGAAVVGVAADVVGAAGAEAPAVWASLRPSQR